MTAENRRAGHGSPSYPEKDRSAIKPAREPGAGRRGMAARHQVRWLPDARPRRRWPGAAADANRSRLDQQVSRHRRRGDGSPSGFDLYRWRVCGVRADGITSFSLIQNASDTRNGEALVIFQFDLLHVDGEDPSAP